MDEVEDEVEGEVVDEVMDEVMDEVVDEVFPLHYNVRAIKTKTKDKNNKLKGKLAEIIPESGGKISGAGKA
ncbi:MAG: hypothetical protein J1E02_00235 [Coprobacter sp.]|nr:hypothetical protein [Coprobacter sp.]